MSFEDLLSEYVLGTLPSEQRRQIDVLVADSPQVRCQVDAAAEALALGVAQGLGPVAAARPLRERLMATLASPDRFAPFLPALMKLFELPAETIRVLLARAETDGAFWETRLDSVDLPGTELFHFQVGPHLAVGGAAGGVLRLRPGATFPRHTHGGEETTFVLEGALRIENQLVGPGATFDAAMGATHEFSAAPERSLLIMVLHHGITFSDSTSAVGAIWT
jgi:putative transcriptional regulator